MKQSLYIVCHAFVLVLTLFLLMNASDFWLQQAGVSHYIQAGSFPVSHFISPIFNGMSESAVMMLERTFWWLHIIGILCFLNYLYFAANRLGVVAKRKNFEWRSSRGPVDC